VTPLRPGNIFRLAARYFGRDLPADLIAGLALAAVALPSQMATAHLAHFPPAMGFIAFAAAVTGFSLVGANHLVVACADSTIAPIFAGGLAAMAAAGSPAYVALSASSAVMVGGILICCGLFRLGRIADLVSKPVTIGFLAGIACHIVISQLPSLLGIMAPEGKLLDQASVIMTRLGETNLVSLWLGLTVFAVTVCAHWISPRIPGALLGIAVTTIAVYWFKLEHHGVAVVGDVAGEIPPLRFPAIAFNDLVSAAPLAFIIVAMIMVQTGATTREFPSASKPLINRDFAGIGAANLLAGLFGVFPVDASPPLTEIVAESGGRSKIASLAAAALLLAIAWNGKALLAHVPMAALAGTLIFVAVRLVQIPEIILIFRRTRGEFLLIAATFTAIVFLPIGTGVAAGIILSLLHGLWSMTSTRLIIFERVPGTTIWWPPSPSLKGETVEGVLVMAFQAPLSFLNAYKFQDDARTVIKESRTPPNLIILEASGIAEIDFTAAGILLEFIKECKRSKITFAVARLESVRTAAAFKRFRITDAVRRDHFFRSVEEAIRALAKKQQKDE